MTDPAARHAARVGLAVLTGIVFVLKTGINWEDLPAELGWGCGKTCKAYLKEWQEAGIWQRLHHILLDELQEAENQGEEAQNDDSGVSVH